MNSAACEFSFLVFLILSQSAFAADPQEDIEILKQKYTQNVFKDSQGLGDNSESLLKMAQQFDSGDELVIRFEYDKSTNLDPKLFPTTDDLVEIQNEAYRLLEKQSAAQKFATDAKSEQAIRAYSKETRRSTKLEDYTEPDQKVVNRGTMKQAAAKAKEAKQLQALALADLEKVKELKKQMMESADGKTFTVTIKLTDMQGRNNRLNLNPAQNMAKESLLGLQLKKLKIVSVDRLPASHAQAKANLLRSISKGGLKNGVSGALAAGAISLTGIAEAATAERTEKASYKLPIKAYQEPRESQGAQ